MQRKTELITSQGKTHGLRATTFITLSTLSPKRIDPTNVLTKVERAFDERQKLFQRMSKALLTRVKRLIRFAVFHNTLRCIYLPSIGNTSGKPESGLGYISKIKISTIE